MPNLYVARRTPRVGVLLSPDGKTPLLFYLPKTRRSQVDSSELDELIRANLERQGVTKESDVQSIVSKSEEKYEHDIKVVEASREVKRLLAIRAAGGKIMSVGQKKWRQVFHPAVKGFKE